MIYERFADMPLKVKALAYETPDGDYVILYNPKYDKETLKAAAEHELRHIGCLDFEDRDGKDINIIENTRPVGRKTRRKNDIP